MTNQQTTPNPPVRKFAGPREAYQMVRTFLTIAQRSPQIGHPSPSFLATGPAGCGKAALFHVVAAELGVPVVELDPLDYLPALGGAVPRRIDDAVSEFCGELPDLDPKRWLGIILMRGIERLARAGEVGALLQANLASLIRRENFRTFHNGQMVEVNPASQITFVFTSSLPDFTTSRHMGFNGHDSQQTISIGNEKPTDEALAGYGFTHTFLDAVKLKIHLPALTRETLGEVMRGPDFAARAMRFAETALGIKLDFTRCALDEIASQALALGRNSHSLETVIYRIIENVAIQKELHFADIDTKITVDAATVKGGPAAAIVSCRIPPPPELSHGTSTSVASSRTLRRTARGSGSSPETRLANASDLKRWTL